jgi:hypothetical protein
MRGAAYGITNSRATAPQAYMRRRKPEPTMDEREA